METIIKKAIEGGYKNYYETSGSFSAMTHFEIVCDTLFWQALGKACGWQKKYEADYGVRTDLFFLGNAMQFHEINLTEGWDKAVEYLQELISPIKEWKQ